MFLNISGSRGKYIFMKIFGNIIRQSAVILLLLSGVTAVARAQGRIITGKVTDGTNGQPLAGGTVFIKGTTIGTATAPDGSYQVTIRSNNDTLVFSFVGLMTREVPVGDKTVINITLNPKNTELNDVVVIGYGTQKKSDLTGSVAVVSSREISKTNAPTLDRALQGKAAGVVVTNTSGMPGSGVSIKIRGIGSINKSSEPLYVVDGIPVANLNSLDPSTIQSIQVLKDASGSAIYGSRAANGVILIETKRGEKGKTKVHFSTREGVSQIPRRLDVMNADEYAGLMKKAYALFPGKELPAPYTDSVRAKNGNVNTDWQKEITQAAWNQNYDLAVYGGGDYSKFAVSGNYYSEKGILVNTGFQRFNIMANSDFTIRKIIKIGETLTISRNHSNYPSHKTNGNPWVIATVASPLMPVYAPSDLGGYAGPTDTTTAVNERTNPLAEQMLNENKGTITRILSRIYAEVEVIKGLKYKIKFGFNYNNNQGFLWSPKYELGNLGLRSNPVSTLTQSSSQNKYFLLDNLLTYTHSFRNHNLTLLAGYSTEQTYYESFSATGVGFNYPELNVLSQALAPNQVSGFRGEHKLESFLGRVIYNYNEKYLLTASIRRDGSSNFGPNNRYGYFPSFSLGWRIDKDFLQNVDQIQMLKLRLGWGATGNQNIGSFQYVELMDPPKNSWYAFGKDQQTYYGGMVLASQGNPDIKWESAKMTNIGIDLYAFNNRLQFTAEYYIKNQDNMLVRIPLSDVFGKLPGVADPFVNLGKIQNRGLELNAIYKNEKGKFQYNVSANFSTLKNTVKYLPGDDIYTPYTVTAVGHAIGSFYGYVAEGIFQSQEEVDNHAVQETGTAPGDIKFKDLNHDGVINSLDRTIIGKPFPDFDYGLGFNCSYLGFDFSIFFHGMQNLDVYNAHRATIGIATDAHAKDENKLRETMNYWSEEHPTNSMTRLSIVDENANSRISSWFLEDASFLRIQNIQLGYTLTDKTIKFIDRIRFYISSNNLYTFTKYSGYDPEVGNTNVLYMGIDEGYYPAPRMYQFGIQADF